MALGRWFLFLIFVALLVLVAHRAVTVSSNNESVTITINKQKVKQTGKDALKRGRQAVEKTGEYLEEASKQIEHWEGDSPPPT